jgi:hypothetical protein
MERRIVWVHGIGNAQPGYSQPWQANIGAHLGLESSSYVEVVWEPVMDRHQIVATLGEEGDSPFALSPQEQVAEEQVRLELAMILQARDSALREAESAIAEPSGEPRVLGDGASGVPVEWSEVYEPESGVLGPSSWLRWTDEYIGDFTRYLVSPSIRTAVKAELKQALIPLAPGGAPISIVSHSWGTVVAYESLLDLEVELPTLRVADFFTLGSPLWMVGWLLQDRSGRKPRQAARWVNIAAKGDRIGSWLRPGFRVDKDYLVPAVGQDAHNSYFVEGNMLVQRDLIAGTILS